MAKSYVTYVGDGTTTNYAVTFPYLSKSHVTVLLDGDATTAYTWITDSSIQLNAGFNGTITIARVTPTEPLVDFTDGSVLTENQLDIATIQSLYVAEETQDATKKVFNSLPGDGSDGVPIGDGVNWNAEGLKIINLKDGTRPQDAVTKAQLDAAAPNLDGSVNDAKMWAEKAEDEADRAQDIADSLKADVDGANAAAANAKASELAAKASEEAAKASENAAALSATQADASQKAALASENAAAVSATEAKTAENNAKGHAADAALTAEFVEDARIDAEESADEAAASAAEAAASAAAAKVSETNSKASADKSQLEYEKAKYIVDTFNPAFHFKGSVDITAPAPTDNEQGDTYVVEETGVAHESYVGIAGTTVPRDSIVVYGDGFDWTVSGMSGGLDSYSKGEVDAMLDALDAVPAGLISIWSGAANAIPEDWALCDGTNGTPNLRDKFVVGAGSAYAVNATGGSKDAVAVSHSHTVTVNTNSSLTGWWDFKNRGGSSFATPILAGSSGGKCTHTNRSNSGSYGEGYRGEAGSGSSRANLNVNHNHTASANAAGVAGTDKNLPPYFALCYIMKLAKSKRRDIANLIKGIK